MKVLKTRWEVNVEHEGKQIHSFTTDKEEWLSSVLEVVGTILETMYANVPRKEYVLKVKVLDE